MVASFAIKSHRSWPIVNWLGEAEEEVVLAGPHRFTRVSLPDGKLKKKMKKVQPLMKDAALLGKCRSTDLCATSS